jgi:hypoxanthine phosphoribosyltransferase
MTDKYNYYYDEYYNDIATLHDRFVNVVNPHIVGVYRGSLPMATHLSNVLECPMSIIKFQSRDGEDKKAEWLLNLTEDKSVRNKPQFFPYLIVVDDVYDTGKTFRAIKELPEFHNNPDYSLTALFGNANEDGVSYLHEQLYRWIVYPWERVKGEM